MAYKEHQILFNGEMVRAILEGRKSQTRRPMMPQPPEGHWWAETKGEERLAAEYYPSTHGRGCPCGIPGDRLWVRETFVLEETDALMEGCPYREMDEPGEFGPYLVPHYRATEPEPYIIPLDLGDSYDDRTRWHPSIHMPKWASRITLEVTDVRVQRVQDISDGDAWDEGYPRDWAMDPVPQLCHIWFREQWDAIYAKPKPVRRNKRIMYYISYPWEEGTETRDHRGLSWFVYGNPWVFITDFRRIRL